MNQIPDNHDRAREPEEEQLLRELQQILWNIKKECYRRRNQHKKARPCFKNHDMIALFRDRLH